MPESIWKRSDLKTDVPTYAEVVMKKRRHQPGESPMKKIQKTGKPGPEFSVSRVIFTPNFSKTKLKNNQILKPTRPHSIKLCTKHYTAYKKAFFNKNY